MNIRTIIAAAAVVIGATIVAAPAQAATDDCDQACVDALRAQVAGLTDENTNLRADLAQSTLLGNAARADAYDLRAQLWDAGVALQAARQETSKVQSALAIAYVELDRRTQRVIVQRARIKELRQQLRDVV